MTSTGLRFDLLPPWIVACEGTVSLTLTLQDVNLQ
jgi:hypothetical protein